MKAKAGTQDSDPVALERRRLGLRLRELRRLRTLTARELAESAGVSASLISQLENGRIEATVGTLRRIAASLDVPIADFFLDPGDGVHQGSNGAGSDEGSRSETAPLVRVVRRNRRKHLHIPESNYTFELLTPDLQGSIEFCWFELEPGHPTEESMPHGRGGEECALVLEGTMHLIIGDQEYVLEAGDSCVFDPSIPHRVENRGTEKLVQISAITPPSF